MQILIIASQENLTEFEDHLVTVCGKLCSRTGDISPDGSVTTLLHLSASLGLARLTCSLLHWAAESPGPQLAREVDALALDSEGYTPLVSAESAECVTIVKQRPYIGYFMSDVSNVSEYRREQMNYYSALFLTKSY